MNLIAKIRNSAKGSEKRIVLPEGTEERTLRAADVILEEELARLILIGNEAEIKSNAAHWNLKHIARATILDPINNPQKEHYADLLFQLRRHKGLSMDQALTLVEDPLYLGVLLIKNGDADGEVAGADNATGDVLRPAFQVIKTLPGISAVSGAFFMVVPDKRYGEDGVLVFADCAVNPDPTVKELAEIAVSSAKTAQAIAGFEPRVAMLSFSTKGSAQHEKINRVVEATQLAKAMAPGLLIDGELQADAAIVEAIGHKKSP
ncbi:MAG: phosphate acetyltransferase, partial [Bacteroidales bacterium]|nr:phosphate acetyltransferase [Bacteroidales bacterium]